MSAARRADPLRVEASMKALPRRKGNYAWLGGVHDRGSASMKAPPKRKGNSRLRVQPVASPMSLNESLR